ncbi:MAG: hypothetical protein J5826_04445 [Bacteroidales bacterium]|nr:hypothetical protein [Bacteroidales bacterium]
MSPEICPYPGLRPFTEEESIFFKGRDMHIRQIIKLLEENKMAFITGASGDGKSSMVYAGVLPNIRAGFCKAKYNGWLIADFKPQKNPFLSLCESTANQLGISKENVQAKLRFGFSSLVTLYKESPYYTDSEQGKNLLIIADQFEEIFTNLENFSNGKPSDESYITINLLLETIRLSIIEKLPIYVIFTMRSDFISQCTVFKNLPEYIAYSQFFVPQLKRNEIRQVIEEPAKLAGGSISPRLTEIIINNLNSGFDQLPVLQHALNLLWKMAENGEVEMDLIHLAQIAGISSDALSIEDRAKYNVWFATLPEYQQKYYENPSLDNILNAHAGILYESAYDYFMENIPWAEKNITPEESKEIIETVFKSLTKTDNKRQVRNRCTINEITGIINKPHITNATVCGVINIFRTPENTLLQPFSIPGKLDTQYLSGDTVLDVTHEALIRNWKMLAEWAAEEETFLKDYHDFASQMNRWLSHNREEQYLLSSGTYSYFLNWYIANTPNPYRFLKYDNTKNSYRQKLKLAQNQYENCQDFIELSDQAIKNRERSKRRKIMSVLMGLAVFTAALIVLSAWALREQRTAHESAIYAQQQADSAKQQRERALNAQQIAERAILDAKQQRNQAQLNASTAKNERDNARRAQQLAEYRRREADSLKDIAELNLQDAEFQKAVAEMAKRDAEEQARVARQATDSATLLYSVAMSNAMAMKAKSEYGDKILNLRIAYTAYNLNRRNNVTQNDAELYDAMLYAMEINNMIKPLKTTTETIADFTVDEDGRIIVITQIGQIFGYTYANKKTKEVFRISDFVSRDHIHKAIFVTPEIVVYSTTDKETFCINFKDKNRTRTKLSVQGDYIKSAMLTPDRKYIAVAYLNGRIAILDADDPDSRPMANYNTKTSVADIFCYGKADVYILTQNATMLRWNFITNTTQEIFKQTGMNAFAMTAIDSKKLAICFSKGDIQFLDLKTGTKESDMLGAHNRIERIIYDENTKYMAMTSLGNRISVINAKRRNNKPLVVDDFMLHNFPVKSISFNSEGTMFVLTEENVIRFFDLDINTYAQELAEEKISELTRQEYGLILGKDFSSK